MRLEIAAGDDSPCVVSPSPELDAAGTMAATLGSALARGLVSLLRREGLALEGLSAEVEVNVDDDAALPGEPVSTARIRDIVVTLRPRLKASLTPAVHALPDDAEQSIRLPGQPGSIPLFIRVRPERVYGAADSGIRSRAELAEGYAVAFARA